MPHTNRSDSVKHRVLITVREDSRGSLSRIAEQLRERGLEGVETFELGGVIVGEADRDELAMIRRMPEIEHIEPEKTFRAL